MKPGVPWSVKGIEPEVREAAKTAARRAGLTLGEWLNSLILEQNMDSRLPIRPLRRETDNDFPMTFQRDASPAHADSATDDGQPNGMPQDDDTRRLRDIARQLSELAQREPRGPAPRDPAGDRAAISRLANRIEEIERQTVEALTAVGERLSTITHQIATLPRIQPMDRPEDVPGYTALESAIRNVVEHIEISEKRTRDSLKSIQDRILDLAPDASRTVQQDGFHPPGAMMDGLDARLAELAGRISRLEAVSKGRTPDHLQTDIGEITSEVARINRRLDEFQSLASMHDVEALRIALEQISARVAQGQDNRPFADLEGRLAALASRIDEAVPYRTDHPGFAQLEENIAAVTARMAHAEQQFGHIERMERAIVQLHESLLEGREAAFQAGISGGAAPSMELAALREGLEALRESTAGAERRHHEALSAVQVTLSQIVEKIAAIEADAPAIPPLASEPRESELSERHRLRSHEAAVRAAADAAASAVAATQPLSTGDDFIAAARRAAQAAATRPSALRSEYGQHAVVSGGERRSLFAFLRRDRKTHRTATHTSVSPSSAYASAKGKARRKLLLAGIVLLAAVSAFAFSMLVSKPRPAAQTGHTDVSAPSLAAGIRPTEMSPEQQYQTGVMHERGAGRPEDMAEALFWYERAAAGGHLLAMHNAAVIAAGDRAGPSDPSKAMQLFEAAAQAGLSESQFNLAVMLENGRGVPVDLAAAQFWYDAAGRGGDLLAANRAATLAALLPDPRKTWRFS